jgi:prophage regulatory protein
MEKIEPAKLNNLVRPDALLSWEALRDLIPLSRPQIWRLRSAGQFPQPIRLSPNRIAWKASDVLRWIESRPTA